jgi:hypothetical protein
VRGLLVLLVLTGACQRKADVPTCDAMADHVQTLFEPADDFAKSVRGAFAERCTKDAWSDEMRSCVGTTKSLLEPQNCKQKLSPEQQTKLETELKKAEEREAKKILPAVCSRYEQVVAQVVACDKLPQDVRDHLTKRLQDAKAAWATMVDKSSFAPACSDGIRVLKQAASECPNSAKW